MCSNKVAGGRDGIAEIKPKEFKCGEGVTPGSTRGRGALSTRVK
jgi:hypothetical protein